MRQKFFTNTIQSKFIKSLLETSYLPNCNSCRDGDYLIKNKTYAYMGKLVRCTKSGFLNSSKMITENFNIFSLDKYSDEQYKYQTKLKIDTTKPVYLDVDSSVKTIGSLDEYIVDNDIENEIYESVTGEQFFESYSQVEMVFVENTPIEVCAFRNETDGKSYDYILYDYGTDDAYQEVSNIIYGYFCYEFEDDGGILPVVPDDIQTSGHYYKLEYKYIPSSKVQVESIGPIINIHLDSNYSLIHNLRIVVPKNFDMEELDNKIKIKVTGRNMFDPQTKFTKNCGISDDGLVGYSASRMLSDYITVCPNTEYAFSGLAIAGTGIPIEIVFYDKCGGFIGKISGNEDPIFTTPENCYKILVTAPTSRYDSATGGISFYVESQYKPVQLVQGDTPATIKDYEYRENIVYLEHPEIIEYGDCNGINLMNNSGLIVGIPIQQGDNNIFVVDSSSTYCCTYNYVFTQCYYYTYVERDRGMLPRCNFGCEILDRNSILITASGRMFGDVNDNCITNRDDIYALQKYVADRYDENIETTPYISDLNCDGIINNDDMLLLKKMVNSTAYNSRISYTPDNLCEYDVISDYDLYEKSFNSRNFISAVNYYDNLTHKRLGNLLRYKRDLEDLNLMPFYNCFCGRWLSTYKIKDDFEIVYSNTGGFSTKCALVPIKLNKTYQIALESAKSVMISPIILGGNDFLLKTKINNQDVDLTPIAQKIEKSLVRYDSIRFKFPVTYCLDTTGFDDEEFISKYEDNLFILIQIDNDVNTSLAVIEGDFNSRFVPYVMDSRYEKSVTSNREFDKSCLSSLSLFRLSDGYSYPFSDRLIEYLLLNVIDNRDPNPNNVLIMRGVSKTSGDLTGIGGIYSDYYRRNLYNLITESYRDLPPDDITGFVDKDMEKFLMSKGMLQ